MSSLGIPPGAVTVTLISSGRGPKTVTAILYYFPQNNLWSVTILLPMVILEDFATPNFSGKNKDIFQELPAKNVKKKQNHFTIFVGNVL